MHGRSDDHHSVHGHSGSRDAMLNQDLHEVVFGTGHDLRSPLRAIDGFAHLLEHELRFMITPAAQRYFERTHDLVTYAQQLITQMMDFAKLGRLEQHATTLDLSRMAAAIIEDHRAMEPSREVDVRIQPGLRAHADHALMRRLLQNLLGNAWKFTRHVRPAKISFDGVESHAEYVLRIQDNGCGFDPESASKLFRPFQRLHSVSRYEGEGIGLVTAKHIVLQHGGTIHAEAAPQGGASFVFTLPKSPL